MSVYIKRVFILQRSPFWSGDLLPLCTCRGLTSGALQLGSVVEIPAVYPGKGLGHTAGNIPTVPLVAQCAQDSHKVQQTQGTDTMASLHVTTFALQMCPKNTVTSDQTRSDLGQWRSRSRQERRIAQVSQESSGTNPTLCVPALNHSTLTFTQYTEALRYTGSVPQGR